MARQAGPIFLERTIDDVIFYKMNGQYYVRMVPCFPDIRRSPRFRGTMVSAKRMGRASKIGAAVYKTLPAGLKRFDRYRALTGAAFHLLKEGRTGEETFGHLFIQLKDSVDKVCAIAMSIYKELGIAFRREWMLWALADEALAMLEQGKTADMVQAELWKMYVAEFEEGYREEGEFLHMPAMAEKKVVGERKHTDVFGAALFVTGEGKLVDRRYVVVQSFAPS